MFNILDEVCTPRRGTKYSAYVDLFAREDVVIGAGKTKVVPLGVKLNQSELVKSVVRDYHKIDDFLQSHYLEVALRSSLAVKGLIMPNGIGIIDLDYQGEIGLILHNPITTIDILNKGSTCAYTRVADTMDSKKISKGDKVAQCTLKEHKGFLLGYESDVIRDGGYGSTGK